MTVLWYAGSGALASANALVTTAMQAIGAQHGSLVLQHYRFGHLLHVNGAVRQLFEDFMSYLLL